MAAITVAGESASPGRFQQAGPASDADQLLAKARVVFGRLPDAMPGSRDDTPAMVRLGRKLYCETSLSAERQMSCYTCHPVDGRLPGAPNTPLPAPAHGKPILRDAPTVLDAGYQAAEFWDGRAADLLQQARMPLFNPIEMAMPSERICMQRVRELPYSASFREVFADKDPFTLANVVRAIAAYEHTLISRGRFDDYLAGDQQAITPQEKQGLSLFMEIGCASCHNAPMVGGNLFNRVGIFRPYSDTKNLSQNRHSPSGGPGITEAANGSGAGSKDVGRYALTKREPDRYVFKVPSLRNVTLTSPYFHDGQVTALAEAVDLMAWMQLDRQLSDAQIELLLRFLTTLADKPRTTAPAPRVARPQWTPPDPAAVPAGEQGRLISQGRELLFRTYGRLGKGSGSDRPLDGSRLNCCHCHPDAGTKAYGIPWVGVTHRYPRRNHRSGGVMTLEDRINDCFERSLNGRALAADSPEIKAIGAYMAWLSDGAGRELSGILTPPIVVPERAADLAAGRVVYQEYCQTCHGPSGAGYRSRAAGPNGEQVTPALWGPDSYNNGAGMARVLTAAAFIRTNMPFGMPWDRPALTDDEAFDVAAYVNSQPRPAKANLDQDYPDRTKKPIDCPYGPYADDFPQSQHQFGPFAPIRKSHEARK